MSDTEDEELVLVPIRLEQPVKARVTIPEIIVCVVLTIDAIAFFTFFLGLFATLLIVGTENDDCGWDPPYAFKYVTLNGTTYRSERFYHPITNPPFKCHVYEALRDIAEYFVDVTAIFNVPFWIGAGIYYQLCMK
jgi:hypothetical protein